MAMNVIPFKGDGQAALLKLYLDLLNAALDETTASTYRSSREAIDV